MASIGQVKFLTYNVWSREDAVVHVRMQAIGKLVLFHKPDVILFQAMFSNLQPSTCMPLYSFSFLGF